MNKDIELSAYAASVDIIASQMVAAAKWRKDLYDFFNDLVGLCKENGVVIIGHIKGFLKLNETTYFYFSNTGTEDTNWRGEEKEGSAQGKLDFNVLVYGISEEQIENIVGEALEKLKKNLDATTTLSKK